MVGDRMDTDGMFAVQVGCRFALVRSGSTPVGAPVPGPAAGLARRRRPRRRGRLDPLTSPLGSQQIHRVTARTTGMWITVRFFSCSDVDDVGGSTLASRWIAVPECQQHVALLHNDKSGAFVRGFPSAGLVGAGDLDAVGKCDQSVELLGATRSTRSRADTRRGRAAARPRAGRHRTGRVRRRSDRRPRQGMTRSRSRCPVAGFRAVCRHTGPAREAVPRDDDVL